MQSRRMNVLAAIFAICGAVTLAVGLPAGASQHRVAAPRAVAQAKIGHDAARLARAARDVASAEQAVRDNPGAERIFGSMLREARAHLEGGIAAASETAIPVETFKAAVEAGLSGNAGDETHGLADASSGMPKASEPHKAASSVGLELRRRLFGVTRLWI